MGGPYDRNLAREAQLQAMQGGEPRAVLASETFEVSEALNRVLPQASTAVVLEGPSLRPSLATSGRRVVITEPVHITVLDAVGRRRFVGLLPRYGAASCIRRCDSKSEGSGL